MSEFPRVFTGRPGLTNRPTFPAERVPFNDPPLPPPSAYVGAHNRDPLAHEDIRENITLLLGLIGDLDESGELAAAVTNLQNLLAAKADASALTSAINTLNTAIAAKADSSAVTESLNNAVSSLQAAINGRLTQSQADTLYWPLTTDLATQEDLEGFSSALSGAVNLNVALGGSSTPANPLTGQAFNSLSACITWCRQQSFAIDAKININIEAGTYLNQEGFDFTGLPDIEIICPDRVDAAIVNGTTSVTNPESDLYLITIPVNNTESISVGQFVNIVPASSGNWWQPLNVSLPQELQLLGCWKVASKTANTITLRIVLWNAAGGPAVGAIANNRLKICLDPVSLRMTPGAKIRAYNNRIILRNLQIIGGERNSDDYLFDNPIFLAQNTSLTFEGCSFGGDTTLLSTTFGGGWEFPVTLQDCQISTQSFGTWTQPEYKKYTVFGNYDFGYTGYGSIFVGCIFSDNNDIDAGTSPCIFAGSHTFTYCYFYSSLAFLTGYAGITSSTFSVKDVYATDLFRVSNSLVYIQGLFTKRLTFANGSVVEITDLLQQLSGHQSGNLFRVENASTVKVPGSVVGSPPYSPALGVTGNRNSLITT